MIHLSQNTKIQWDEPVELKAFLCDVSLFTISRKSLAHHFPLMGNKFFFLFPHPFLFSPSFRKPSEKVNVAWKMILQIAFAVTPRSSHSVVRIRTGTSFSVTRHFEFLLHRFVYIEISESALVVSWLFSPIGRQHSVIPRQSLIIMELPAQNPTGIQLTWNEDAPTVLHGGILHHIDR